MSDPAVAEMADPVAAKWDRRLLVLGNFLSPARTTRSVCAEVADRLRERGYHVVTASSVANPVLRLLDLIATTWRRRSDYSLAQVDVFSGRAFLWAEAVCWVLRSLRKPYLLALHGGSLPAFARRWPGRVRRLLAGATSVICPSDYLRVELSRFRSDIRSIPNGLTLESYTFRLRGNAAPRLVWLRAFHEIYNPVLAVRAAQALSARFPAVHLTLIGPDKGDGSLSRARQAASTATGTASIEFEGSVPKSAVPACLARADIFLNTTRVDNLPTTVLEAMACGLCVVSTNVGGIPCMLTDGMNALLVPADDCEGVVSAITRLLTDPELADQLSRSGRATAERHDWSVVLPQWEAALEKAAIRGRRT